MKPFKQWKFGTKLTLFIIGFLAACLAFEWMSVLVNPFGSKFDIFDNRYDLNVGLESPSPDGKTVAAFYTISGGGAAGYVLTRLKIWPKSRAFKEDDNYVFEIRHGQTLGVQWRDNRHLVVFYETGSDVYRQLAKQDSISISYVAQKLGAPRPTLAPAG